MQVVYNITLKVIYKNNLFHNIQSTYFCKKVSIATSDLSSLPAKAGFILFLRINSRMTLMVTSGVRVRTRICKQVRTEN